MVIPDDRQLSIRDSNTLVARLPNWSSHRTDCQLHFYSEAANHRDSFTSLLSPYSMLTAGGPPIPSLK